MEGLEPSINHVPNVAELPLSDILKLMLRKYTGMTASRNGWSTCSILRLSKALLEPHTGFEPVINASYASSLPLDGILIF